MANMFRCTLASGGALILTVICDADFAGLTITATDGTTTLTQPCPSSSPYEVEFKLPNAGQWTISGVISGETQSLTIDIPDNVTLHYIPNGSTVIPTDDIQTWLHCAEIWDKNYTTVSQVLSDASTLQALIASSNAVDYMARSTTWSTDVTADASAMAYIGLDDYCADTLLANSTWRNAICNSSYFESVLNVKVPAMTSATTPSGVVSVVPTPTNYYKFFNGSWYLNSGYAFETDPILSYTFTQAIKVYKVGYAGNGADAANNYYLAMNAEVYGDNTKLLDINITQSKHLEAFRNFIYFIMNPSAKYETYRFKIVGPNYNVQGRALGAVQFYGRA